MKIRFDDFYSYLLFYSGCFGLTQFPDGSRGVKFTIRLQQWMIDNGCIVPGENLVLKFTKNWRSETEPKLEYLNVNGTDLCGATCISINSWYKDQNMKQYCATNCPYGTCPYPQCSCDPTWTPNFDCKSTGNYEGRADIDEYCSLHCYENSVSCPSDMCLCS